MHICNVWGCPNWRSTGNASEAKPLSDIIISEFADLRISFTIAYPKKSFPYFFFRNSSLNDINNCLGVSMFALYTPSEARNIRCGRSLFSSSHRVSSLSKPHTIRLIGAANLRCWKLMYGTSCEVTVSLPQPGGPLRKTMCVIRTSSRLQHAVWRCHDQNALGCIASSQSLHCQDQDSFCQRDRRCE